MTSKPGDDLRFDHCPEEQSLSDAATFCDCCGEWDLDGSDHVRGEPCPHACEGCPAWGQECQARYRRVTA